MKYTGFALVAMGVLLAVYGAGAYLVAEDRGAPTAFPVNPTVAFGMAAVSAACGILIVWFGGRGFSSTTPKAPSPRRR